MRTAEVKYESIIPNPKLKLLEQMREVLRLKHYSIRTERSYCDWVRRYVKFHRMRSREELFPGEPKMESFLSELAVEVVGRKGPKGQRIAAGEGFVSFCSLKP